ncbi:MAG: hypothetical protein MUF83_15840 [Acidimicrobiales bacterium]|jgi:hypothetical protein|nr:hypothetical protein [Acidimicrobiales bacterium]
MLLSDDPAWWQRSQQRRAHCPPTSPWVAVAERGFPVRLSPFHDAAEQVAAWERSQAACSAYLRAVGLAGRPDWV